MDLLIDTNVILDMIFERGGCDITKDIFRKIKTANAAAYITASAVTDLFYIIRRETHDTDKTYQVMENILKLVDMLSVTNVDIREAFDKKWKDFEDCVQFTTAKNNKIDYLVTGNKKDFEDNALAVISPEECLKLF